MNQKRIWTLFLALMLAVSMVGCGNSSNQTDTSGANGSTGTEATDAKAFREEHGWYSESYDETTMKGTSINLYGVTDGIIPVLDAFCDDTGISVENLTLKNGEILERVKNEHDAKTVNADIWFTGGADAFISAAESGLLVAYKSPEAESIDAEMKDERVTGQALL
ncbi:MAG: hypothetical protein VB078_04095 [Clostridiaceae bacterium]|nr:hypothetical protein [Clostridiaceae bacterium]